ncbi:MAG: BsuPI-related putative proteinase inhibitor [Longimicrobiales bacterium]
MNKRSAAVVWALMWAACNAQPRDAGGRAAAGEAGSLVLSLEVEVHRDSVRFSLHATNPTTQEIPLEYGSAQRFDFEVRDAAGATLWRWSADQAFAQVVGQERVASGATLKYEAVWQPAGRTGRFVVIGRMVSMPDVREQQTEFEI